MSHPTDSLHTERFYVTTSIPYVNANPHIGHALELVRADVLARHRRLRGAPVRFQSGTDDNSLTNVRAANAEGVPVAEFVAAHGDAFAELRGRLDLSYDDFIRTSTDPRHRGGVETFWRACAERGDFYRKHYTGLYCARCEAYYQPDELVAGRCPEHGTVPEEVSETNWFFRLSRYGDQLAVALRSGRIRIQPTARANEALSFVESGLADFSISRTVERAQGWGIPVPGDPGQVMYVWWDALGNYISSLGFGSADPGEFDRWWCGDGRRVHVIGKGILRFHAVYWPAMLLSAGLPLPTDIYVDDYLTANGQKISKSIGNVIDPAAVAETYGSDAVRWWLSAYVPRIGDTDFTLERLTEAANADLAGGIGNLVQRVVTMVHRYREGVPGYADPSTADEPARRLRVAASELPDRIDDALAQFDHRGAAYALRDVIAAANRYVEETAPWALARSTDPAATAQLGNVLALLVEVCRLLGTELGPFVPALAGAVAAQCAAAADGHLPPPQPLYRRLHRPVPSK